MRKGAIVKGRHVFLLVHKLYWYFLHHQKEREEAVI